MMKRSFILALITTAIATSAFAQRQVARDTLTTQILFRKAISDYEGSYKDNSANIDRFVSRIDSMHADTLIEIKGIKINAGASPEGSAAYNDMLSRKRAHSMRMEIERHLPYLSNALIENAIGVDWDGLAALIEKDPNVPAAQEALRIIRSGSKWVSDAKGQLVDRRKLQLMSLNGGRTWRYIEAHQFESLRGSSTNIACEIVRKPMKMPAALPIPAYSSAAYTFAPLASPARQEMPAEKKPWYFAIRTNMLYDALAVPNIGVDIYLGKNWSIDAIWHYAWWKCDHRHNYWRTYGGDIALRRWFGSKANAKPLTGHHVGLYAQMVTYDFELGGRGYLGPRWSYGGGLEYGYSLPIKRRLNIDFTLGLGYLGGKYYEYIPIDQCYVWQATKQRHWFGPTKLEVSLVWLIGRGNVNVKK